MARPSAEPAVPQRAHPQEYLLDPAALLDWAGQVGVVDDGEAAVVGGGDAEAAIHAWQTLATDADTIPGFAHFASDVRRNLAYWLFIAGRADDGTGLYPLAARTALAHATGQSGHLVEARRLAHRVAVDCAEHLHNQHELTLTSRYEVARWTAQCGDLDRAADQFRTLLNDATRALGNDNSLVLACHAEIDRLASAPYAPPQDEASYWQRMAHW